MKRLQFYATRDDLIGALSEITDLRLTEMGNFVSNEIRQYDSVAAIPDLGQATYGSAIANPSFLVMLRDMKVDVRLLAGNTEMRYLVDQLENPDSVVFQPGGRFGSDALVAGRVATGTDSEVSARMMKQFSKLLTRKFVKIRAFLVGPEAQQLFHQGVRLTDSVDSPREYDLALH